MEKSQVKVGLFGFASVCCFVLILVCTRVFLLILTMPQSARRPKSYLVAHLAMLAIVSSHLLVIVQFDKFQWLQFPGVVETAFKSILDLTLALVPLNMAALSWKKIALSRRSSEGQTMTRCILSKIWTSAGLFTLVSLLPACHFIQLGQPTYKDSNDNLLNMVMEILRLLLFDIFPVGWIIYGLSKTRKKYRYDYILGSIPVNCSSRRNRKLRLNFLLHLIFINIWIPFGLLYCIYKIFKIYKIPTEIIDPFLDIEAFVGLIYISIYPVIHSLTSTNLKHISWFSCTWKPRPINTILTQLTQEMIQERRQTEQCFYRRVLRQNHAVLENIELNRLSGDESQNENVYLDELFDRQKPTSRIINTRVSIEFPPEDGVSRESVDDEVTTDSKINYFSPSPSIVAAASGSIEDDDEQESRLGRSVSSSDLAKVLQMGHTETMI